MSFIRWLLKKYRKPRRSVVFYRHSYYHFYYLAKALRKRGWDAIVVNLEAVDGANAHYYHGEDLNLFDPDPLLFNENIQKFIVKAKDRFKLMHFAGDGLLCFYPEHASLDSPPDIEEWKSAGNKVAYTVSGCNSGTSPTSVAQWSSEGNQQNVCSRCVLQQQPDACNDSRSLAWGGKVLRYCDLIFTETAPALDYTRAHEKVIRDPVTMCLDPKQWHPDLKVPTDYKLVRDEGEILIYHAVGNYQSRSNAERNIKGTPFVFAAVERLQQEGHKVRLIFITNQPNTVVRYYQVQADIIVDQLNYGRYGATAREGMMLGKPVICYLNAFEYDEQDVLPCLDECPLVSATEKNVYEVLKQLICDPQLRSEIGSASRNYAVKWHSADACAERYERIYDQSIGQNGS